MLSLISSGSNKSISTSVYCAKVIIEKENIWTFDGKGEVMLTIMSSLAQDESRSISENIKWGMRKSFADGKVTVPYSKLLGFDKGPDGVLAINEKEARIVRWIFSRCLMEYPPGYIAKRLREMGVPNVHGNSEWSKQTVRCILRHEKHVGDAILQKTYSRDFLTKKRIRNNGQLTKYYVKNDHPAIVTRQQFEEAQRIMSRPASATRNVITMVWSGKFICGECGAFFGPKVWHSTDKYRSIIWKCNLCNKGIWNVAGPIPSFSEKELAAICIGSLNLILGDSSGTKELVESVIRKVIGHSSMHKAERNARLESLLRRLCAKPMKMTVNALDECMFRSLVEKITIFSRSDIRITYKDGTVADLGIRMTESGIQHLWFAIR